MIQYKQTRTYVNRNDMSASLCHNIYVKICFTYGQLDNILAPRFLYSVNLLRSMNFSN